MNKKQKIKDYINLSFISELLILMSVLLYIIHCYHINDNNSLIISSGVILVLFFRITFIIYISLYSWRSLPQSLSSFIFFSINFIQLLFYLFAISLLFYIYYYNITIQPLYLNDISIISQYRYLFLTIISLFLIFSYLFIITFKINIKDYSSLSAFPYLKEEIRKLIDSWGDFFLINIFNKIIDLLYFSFVFQVIFFIIHFILFSVIRLITATLLLYCIFYHGDFRNFLYLTPIMFFVWLLSFFNYTFIIFQENSKTYIRDLIIAVPKTESKTILGILKVDPLQISFKLTEKAILDGFCGLDMYNLTKEWYIQAHVSAYFQVYFKLSLYLNYFIIVMNIFSWFYISYVFFLSSPTDYILSGGMLGWLSCFNKITTRTYITEACRVLPFYQKKT